MRFHVVALPHTATDKSYSSCAFTQNLLNFCKMMKSLGHEVVHYGAEDSDRSICTEHVTTVSVNERLAWWNGAGITKETYTRTDWEKLKLWSTPYETAVKEMRGRVGKRDFICLIGGRSQKVVADAFPNNMSVEYAVGYLGIFTHYRVYASYALMHYVYGMMNVDGNHYDEVIPHYFDPSEFDEPIQSEHGHYLYLGRLIQRKGLQSAAKCVEELGGKLLVASQTPLEHGPDFVVSDEGRFAGKGLEYVGHAGVTERAKLLAGAKCLFAPTQYVGPFESVAVESLLQGTPVVCTDWGAFTETVEHGVDGFRCRSLGEMMWAAKECEKLDRELIRQRAIDRFSLDVVRHRYEDYFTRLLELWDDGWNTKTFTPRPRPGFAATVRRVASCR